MLPITTVLGHRDEVGAIEHAGDAGDAEQLFGERRARGGFAIGKLHRAAVEHEAAGNELQCGGVGRRFGLDKHGILRRLQFKAGALDYLYQMATDNAPIKTQTSGSGAAWTVKKVRPSRHR